MSDKVLSFKPAMTGEQIETTKPKELDFRRTNTNDLMAATFPPLKEIVPDYVYGGFTVLAGRQKLGKTWLAIDWAVAIATGGVAGLGRLCPWRCPVYRPGERSAPYPVSD
jgi:hypothetical protein